VAAPTTLPTVATPAPRPRRRWLGTWRRRLAIAPLLFALLVWSVSCSTTIRPPANPLEPTTVLLLREAMHTGLVMPSPDRTGEYVEFGFGDWSWFALGNDAWYDAFATVLWPTRGGLGRRTFLAANVDALRARVYWADLQTVEVPGARMRALRDALQQQWTAGLPNAVEQRRLGWTFVPSERSYWWANNCADVAAEWFEALDCEVGWAPIRTGLTVAR
jgi:hypothetical protein